MDIIKMPTSPFNIHRKDANTRQDSCDQSVSISVQKNGLFSRIVHYFKSKIEAQKMMRVLKEVKLIRSGKKKATSFDEFLETF